MSDDLSIPSPTYRIPRHRARHGSGDHAAGTDRRRPRRSSLLVVIGGWTLIGHRSTAVPVVQADSRPIRVKPENPGGMQVAGANEDILSGGSPRRRRQAGARRRKRPHRRRCAPRRRRHRPPAAMAALPAPVPAPAADGRCEAASQPSRSPRPTSMRPSPRHRNARLPQATARWCSSPRCIPRTRQRSEWQRLSKRMPDLLRPAPSRRSARPSTTARRCGACAPAASATSLRPRRSASGARQGRRLLGRRLLKAAIVGIAGPTLSADEAALFRAAAAVRRHPVRAQHPVAGAACGADRRPAPRPAAGRRADGGSGRRPRRAPAAAALARASAGRRRCGTVRAAWLTGALIGLRLRRRRLRRGRRAGAGPGHPRRRTR